MATVVNRSQGVCCPHHHKPPSEKEVAKVTETINAWYEAGVSFYSRERLQSMHHQLQKLGDRKGSIWIQDLMGEDFECEVETGNTYGGEKDGMEVESEVTKLFVLYGTIQHTLRVAILAPKMAYRNISISHFMGPLRDRKTKELYEPAESRAQEETEDLFKQTKGAWEKSTQCQDLTLLLQSLPHLKVTKVVAFGNASVSSKSPGCHVENRSLRAAYQYALIPTLKTTFQHSAEEWKGSYAQDPAYSDIDAAVLAEHDIKIVDDPAGFLQVYDESAVISISPDIPVKQVVCDLARPQVLIWYRVDSAEEGLGKTDPDSSRVCKMMDEHYNRVGFPPGLEEYFGRISIYLKKPPRSLDAYEQASAGAEYDRIDSLEVKVDGSEDNDELSEEAYDGLRHETVLDQDKREGPGPTCSFYW